MKRYSDQSKKLMLNVLEYFEKQSNPQDKKFAVKKAAEALKVPVSTLYRIKNPQRLSDAEFVKNMQDKVRNAKKRINPIIMNSLRDIIYKMYASKQHVTLNSLKQRFEQEIPDFSCSAPSIGKWIHKIGFRFKKEDNRMHLMELQHIRMKRVEFLRQYTLHKSMQIFQPVFIDETWVFGKGANRKSWQDGTHATTSKKTGEGTRYIIVHAGNSKGFINNASLIFKSNRKTGDYHDNMNRENFERWFKTQLIPNLEEPSVIIMDNASYHSCLQVNIFILDSSYELFNEFVNF